MAQSGAAGLLTRQLKYMQTAKDLPGISCGLVNNNVFEWEVMLMISDDCKYYGGTYPPLFPAQTLHLLILSYRRQFPLPSEVPTRIPTPSTLPDLQDPNPLPSQYLRRRQTLHINLTSAGGRSVRVRERVGEMVACADAGDDIAECD